MRIARVRSLDEARAALRAGPAVIEADALPAGIGWWREMLNILAAEFGPFPSVLDCADAPGLALAAIRDGIPCIRLRAAPAVLDKVEAIAAAAGVALIRQSGCAAEVSHGSV